MDEKFFIDIADFNQEKIFFFYKKDPSKRCLMFARLKNCVSLLSNLILLLKINKH